MCGVKLQKPRAQKMICPLFNGLQARGCKPNINTIILHFYYAHHKLKNLTLRSVSSLNKPKNSEMKFCENMTLIC